MSTRRADVQANRARDLLHGALFVVVSLSLLASLALTLGRHTLALRPWLALAAGSTIVWALVTAHCERALRAVHPQAAHGRWAPWRHPWRGPAGRALDALANSRLLGVLCEPLPELAMLSDIRDVVYVNYLVPAERLAPLVPPGLELQRLGPEGRYALFTFLTYRHGHFGFRFLGRLRAFFPSPVQTNWRIHVRDPLRGTLGIYFVTNAIDHPLMALAARLTTRGMPMHVLARAALERPDERSVRVRLEPGRGSAPDADLELREAPAPELRGAWKECFETWQGFLAYCVPQDRAMASQPEWGELSRQEIDLGIPLSACVPMAGAVRSARASAIAGDAEPLCFRVPRVDFAFAIELHERLRD